MEKSIHCPPGQRRIPTRQQKKTVENYKYQKSPRTHSNNRTNLPTKNRTKDNDGEINMNPMSVCSSSSSSSGSWSSTKAWIVHGIVAGVAIAVAIGARVYLGPPKKFRSRVVGIIPARFASSRFQGKPLVQILGKPMIQVLLFASLILPLCTCILIPYVKWVFSKLEVCYQFS